jgi:hypothetical protein
MSMLTSTQLRVAALGLALAGAVLAGLALAAPKPAAPAAAPGIVAPLPPLAAAPVPPGSSTLVPMPPAWWLPAAITVHGPHALGPVTQRPLFLRGTPDLPPVAERRSPPWTPPVQLAAGPLARADAPDPAAVPMPALRHRPNIDRPDAAYDPTEDQSRQRALAAVTSLRKAAVPFLRLTIPDPYETRAALEFRKVLPDADPPAACLAMPQRPALPAK